MSEDIKRKQKTGKSKGPAVVCIGGGTGHSTLLRGLRKVTNDITAIVTVSDDGGGSGILRDELGMPPPGDIRSCMQALSNAEPTIEKLMEYRFESGSLSGQSFGNLFLAAINGISESFDKAVIKMGEVLSITGRVLPVTIDDINLWAEFEDGSRVTGESKITAAKTGKKNRIKRIGLEPADARVLPECIDAVECADVIILGPGSLYTSIIPNLLVGGLTGAIVNSNALKIYICNVMTQPGETDGYSVSEHISDIFNHAGMKLFDFCIANDTPASREILERYIKSGAEPVIIDEDAVNALGIKLIKVQVAAGYGDYARHDPDKLAREILRLFIEKAPTKLYGNR